MESRYEGERAAESVADQDTSPPRGASVASACRFAAPAALAALLAAWLGPYGFEALGKVAINTDAGFYLPLARLVAEGLTPHRDFASSYPPAAYYMLGALGAENLGSPPVVQRAIAALHAVNAGLLGVIVFRLCRQAGLALLVPAVYLGALLRFEGVTVVLEPFQVIFLMAALLLLTLRPRRSIWVATGVAAGLSLMAKQYGVLWVPALALGCAWRDVPLEAATRLSRERFDLRGPLYFLLGLPLPFVLFVLLTRQSPVELLVHFATFAGSAGAYAQGAGGLLAALDFLDSTTGVALVGSLGVGAVALVARPTVATLVCFAGCLFSFAAFGVRTYFHYAQLVLPWALLLIVCAASSFRGSRFGPSAVTVSCLIALSLFTGVLQGAFKVTSSKVKRDDQSSQMRLSAELMRAIPDRDAVVVTSFYWLYATTDFRAPLDLYGWQLPAALPGLVEARYAVAPPHRHLSSSVVHDVLTKGGLRKWKTVEVTGWPEIQLYRRSLRSSAASAH